MTDPIADMLARVRNALLARHETTEIPHSKMIERLAQILQEEGYVDKVDVLELNPFKKVRVTLRYDENRKSVIEGLKRYSRPGSRKYVKADAIPEVRKGLGIAIVSTSKGVMTDHQARKLNVGGEVLCTVW